MESPFCFKVSSRRSYIPTLTPDFYRSATVLRADNLNKLVIFIN